MSSLCHPRLALGLTSPPRFSLPNSYLPMPASHLGSVLLFLKKDTSMQLGLPIQFRSVTGWERIAPWWEQLPPRLTECPGRLVGLEKPSLLLFLLVSSESPLANPHWVLKAPFPPLFFPTPAGLHWDPLLLIRGGL